MRLIHRTFGCCMLITQIACASSVEKSREEATEIEAIARSQIFIAPDAALKSADRLRFIARKGDSNQQVYIRSTADWISASALVNLNRPAEAVRFDQRGLAALASVASLQMIRAKLLLSSADALLNLDHVEAAIAAYQAAFRTFLQAKNTHGAAVTLTHIAFAYLNAGDYQSCMKYGVAALQLNPTEPALLATIHNNNGLALFQLGFEEKAIHEFRSALGDLGRSGNEVIKVRVLANLARVQAEARNYAGAEHTLTEAYSMTIPGSAANWRAALDEVAARVALGRGDLKEAEHLIVQALTLAGTSLPPDKLRDMNQAAYQVYRAGGESGKALHYLETYKQFADQAQTITDSRNAALLSARFDFTNQALKISRLRAGQAERDATIARARARLHTTIAVGALAAALVISTLLGIGFVSIRRSRNQVRAANDTLRVTNADLEKALAAKSEFLATTSHEIRTPLNGILGMTQVILADRGTPVPIRERVQLIHGSGETMRALVDDILDVAKMETGELRLHPAEMDLRRLLDDAVLMWAGQAEGKRIAITPELDGCPRMIIADEVRLRQIVFNLMSNAIKFTDRGLVRLTAACEPRGAEERLVIRIADSGIGIPAGKLGEIFESFKQADGGTTRRHGGTGLGLAICRNLARAMGGDVTVESIVGTGSVFIVDLPLVRGMAVPATPVARARATALGDAAMLVIEANPLAQGIMRALLGPNVRDLSFIAELDEAINRIESGAIDHVVADGAVLGLDIVAAGQVADAARAAGAHLSLLWPSPDADIVAAARAANVEQVIGKPIPAQDLLATIRLLYEEQMAGREIAA